MCIDMCIATMRHLVEFEVQREQAELCVELLDEHTPSVAIYFSQPSRSMPTADTEGPIPGRRGGLRKSARVGRWSLDARRWSLDDPTSA